MNFLEAVKTGLPIARQGKKAWGFRRLTGLGNHYHIGEGFLPLNYLLENFVVEAEDILADDWIAEEPKVLMTKSQVLEFYREGRVDESNSLRIRGYTEYTGKLKEMLNKYFGPEHK